jgi:uncharacterized protein YceH (UPF0502 family)
VPLDLSAEEARVLGCLIEKSIITPDQYPLTLNSLTTACNQKSARDPVMSLEPGSVQHTIRVLETRHFVTSKENFKRGTEKYKHRFCNTRYSDYQFDAPQLAIVCLLLLRGAQTPGEIRARSGRLYIFADNEAVMTAIRSLVEFDNGPLLVKLPRTPGRKDSEYMHLFSGPIDFAETPDRNPPADNNRISTNASGDTLEHRVGKLETEIAELKEKLATLN